MEKFVLLIDNMNHFHELHRIMTKYCCLKERGYENRDFGYISEDFSISLTNSQKSNGAFLIGFPDSATFDILAFDVARYKRANKKVLKLDFALGVLPVSGNYHDNRSNLQTLFENEYEKGSVSLKINELDVIRDSGRHMNYHPDLHIMPQLSMDGRSMRMGMDFGHHDRDAAGFAMMGLNTVVRHNPDEIRAIATGVDKWIADGAEKMSKAKEKALYLKEKAKQKLAKNFSLDENQIVINDGKGRRIPESVKIEDSNQKMKISKKQQNDYTSKPRNFYTPSSVLIIP